MKFENEEIDGKTLQSDVILTDQSMNNLRLTTIVKKNCYGVNE